MTTSVQPYTTINICQVKDHKAYTTEQNFKRGIFRIVYVFLKRKEVKQLHSPKEFMALQHDYNHQFLEC